MRFRLLRSMGFRLSRQVAKSDAVDLILQFLAYCLRFDLFGVGSCSVGIGSAPLGIGFRPLGVASSLFGTSLLPIQRQIDGTREDGRSCYHRSRNHTDPARSE